MEFRLFSVFITVLICLDFGEVNSLNCAHWCGRDCDNEWYIKTRDECNDAKSKCDCTAASYEQLKGLINDYRSSSYEQLKELIKDNRADSLNMDLVTLVLGVAFVVVVVGIVGCCIINRNIKQIGQNNYGGGPAGPIYQPTPSIMNYGYQPAGAGPPPLSYGTPSGEGPHPLTYTNPNPTGSPIPPNAVP